MSIELRPSVQQFAEQMELVLRKNDYKGGWNNCSLHHLRYRLNEEVGEYFGSIAQQDFDIYNIESDKKELIDIANFCMMLHERTIV